MLSFDRSPGLTIRGRSTSMFCSSVPAHC